MLKVNIRKLIIKRLENNLSVSQLAEIAGISLKTLSNIENYKVIPNPLTINKLANALNIPVDSLFFE